MARILKGTRARGLPPKVLLSQRQDTTGSFPTIWRTSSDNRTGRYPVFFSDNKVVQFNQPVSNVGIIVDTYSEYEEKVITIGSPTNSFDFAFDTPFTSSPMVIFTELSSSNNLQNVNAFTVNITSTEVTGAFSAPFAGTLVYRAIFLSSPGNPVNVIRSPRFSNEYSLVVNQLGLFFNSNNDNINYSDFGSVPTENYVTFYDFAQNNQANISASITYITNTNVQVTGSAMATTVLHYMGFGETTASIDVKGIVYPLLMTPQAINADLSTEAKSDLYKQPFFSGSEIVNQPIVASGSMKKGVSDIFVTFTPGQDIEPFQDFANPEVDGKISASIGGVNPFYATGSLVETTGLGFQQPLWSKNKIEIPLNVSASVTFGQSTYDDQDKIMAYYDFSQKTYVPIGDARGNHQLLTASVASPPRLLGFGISNTEYYSSKSIGFSPSTFGFFSLGDIEKFGAKLFATPVNSFGFPYDTKRYGVVTNSATGALNTNENMLLDMSSYISEPFLLEKIVLEFTGAMSSSGIDESGFSAISTFFILNQTNTVFSKQENTYTTLQAIDVGLGPVLDFGFNNTIPNGTTGIDLVTYCQISALTSSLLVQSSSLNDDYIRDLNIYQEAQQPVVFSYGLNPNFGYSGSFIVSSSVKSPTALEYSNIFRTWYVYSVAPSFPCVNYSWLDNRYGGRKMLFEPSGRNWKQFLAPQNPAEIVTATTPITFSFTTQDKTNENNPYILLPTDKLIFGWQAPLSNISGSFTGNCGDLAQLHFPVGEGKVIFYGSTLRFNPETNQLEEYHDTLNQLVSSTSIHEVIGE
jgi:hypothetical protein